MNKSAKSVFLLKKNLFFTNRLLYPDWGQGKIYKNFVSTWRLAATASLDLIICRGLTNKKLNSSYLLISKTTTLFEKLTHQFSFIHSTI